MKTKKCPKCGEIKSINEFYKSGQTKDGLKCYCKVCTATDARNRYRKNPLKCREKELKKLYGIDLKDYNKMYQEQNGCCAICGIPQSELNHTLHVDHNHKTNKVRGLLCGNCNTKLGWYEKQKKNIESYLE